MAICYRRTGTEVWMISGSSQIPDQSLPELNENRTRKFFKTTSRRSKRRLCLAENTPCHPTRNKGIVDNEN